jgi:diguanylate cyclase (GGDEF)-like protein
MKELSERSLTAGYGLALGLIALLALASHITLDRVLAEHEGSAAIINVSGRQRMLSQRIASMAAQYALGSPTAKADLLQAADRFEAANRQLADDSAQTVNSSSAAVIREIYFGAATALDARVAAYVALARHIVAQKPDAAAISPDMAKLFAEARSPLLTQLDKVVQLHQEESEWQLGRLLWLQHITLAIVLLTLTTEAMLIFRPMVRRIANYANDLRRLANIDALTGILNRRSFVERAEVEIMRARRAGKPLCVLMLDIDHFKQINDTYGHAGGDTALRALAQTLRGAIRPSDLLGRLGGEEFAVLLPDTAPEAALVLAERLRAVVDQSLVNFGGLAIRQTVSIGCAAGLDGEAGLDALLRDADHALYAAKAAGRNRVADGSVPAIA